MGSVPSARWGQPAIPDQASPAGDTGAADHPRREVALRPRGLEQASVQDLASAGATRPDDATKALVADSRHLNHLFVTQDYAPDLGGMARRHVELCRRFADGVEEETVMSVSTVASPEAGEIDPHEPYRIYRQPFPFERANRFSNQVRWGRWLVSDRSPAFDVLHCGNIRPVGYAVAWAHRKLNVPYFIYVNGGDLLRERMKSQKSVLKRRTARSILGRAAGIV